MLRIWYLNVGWIAYMRSKHYLFNVLILQIITFCSRNLLGIVLIVLGYGIIKTSSDGLPEPCSHTLDCPMQPYKMTYCDPATKWCADCDELCSGVWDMEANCRQFCPSESLFNTNVTFSKYTNSVRGILDLLASFLHVQCEVCPKVMPKTIWHGCTICMYTLCFEMGIVRHLNNEKESIKHEES